MKKRMNVFLLVILLSCLVLGGFSHGNAEDNPSEFSLEEITVTAQKRAENQQKVPIAMEIISGEDLAGTGKTNIDEILSNLSGVIINSATDGMRVSLRGIANEDSTQGDLSIAQPTVGINVDGSYNKSGSAAMNLFDIERVEVLMGPQSTLYANTSPGGIVNIVTASPKTDKFSASVNLEAGNFDRFMGQAMLNVPIINEKLATRLATNWEKKDSYIVGDSQTGEDTKIARLKTLWQPNDKLSVTVTGNYTQKIGGGKMGGVVKTFDYEDGYWATQPSSEKPFEVEGPVTNPWTEHPGATGGGGGPPGAPQGPNQGSQDTKAINAEIVWDTGIGSLSLFPQYSKTSSDDSGQYQSSVDDLYYTVYTEMRSHQTGVEARMSSDPDFFFKWILGLNYYEEKSERGTTYSNPDDTPGMRNSAEDNKAVFANATYPITDKFRGSAGFRMSWDEVTSEEAKAQTKVSGQSYSNPDYSLGFEYDLSEDTMLYANYASSYRVNAMKITQSQSAPPEKLKAYTLGAKNRFFDNRLQLNGDIYYYDYTNKNSRVTNDGRMNVFPETIYASWVTGPDGVTPYSDIIGEDIPLTGQNQTDEWVGQEGGKFRTVGADLSATWIITSNDRLDLSLAWIDSQWIDMPIEFYWKRWTEAGTAATGYTGNVFGDEGKNLKGRQVTYSPTWSGSLAYEHSFELGKFGSLLPHIDIAFKSDYVLDYEDIYAPYDRQEAYYTINANVTYFHISDRWTLNAYIRNATDYAAKTFWNKQAGIFGLGISDPRTYGAVFSLKY